MPKRERRAKLIITETEPVPLIKDFNTFLNYLVENKPYLTKKKGVIPPKVIYQINQLMSSPNMENTPRTHQDLYPKLHLFYHLVFSGKLFKKVSKGSSRTVVQKTDRMDEYLKLTLTEKYFFLLETFWVDCDWNEFGGENRPRFEYMVQDVEGILKLIAKMRPGKTIFLEGKLKQFFNWIAFEHPFMRYLSLFGFFKLTRDDELHAKMMGTKKDFVIASLTPSSLGVTLAPILCRRRPLEKWNLPLRQRIEGKILSFPGLEADEQNEKLYVPFFKAFTKFFPEGELQKTLSRKTKELIKGTFIFKVSLGGIWRRIAISGEDTLEELHVAINNAFDFDFDHLYAFFMDGKRWSHNAINAPQCDEGPYTDDLKIGELDLSVGQQFLYLFDFGDEWCFWVKLEKIRKDEPGPPEPKIIESKGEAPQQYPSYWDDGEEGD